MRSHFRSVTCQQEARVTSPNVRAAGKDGRKAARRAAPPRASRLAEAAAARGTGRLAPSAGASCRFPAVPPRPSGEMEAESLMVLYGDDSVEVHYAGGSRLLLSPCGCEYLYEAALPAAAHPLQPAETTRQRVAFVVSAYRVRGGQALSDPLGRGGVRRVLLCAS